ncbi:MAG: hypothetical protein EOP14_01690 [Pseudomonas sp.]|nr:MAG: hypothetical protein EOP14_01690 [Pseudomonas sp.]
MKFLRYLLIAIGVLGAALTMPAPSMVSTRAGLLFLGIFFGFIGFIWFVWRLDRPKMASDFSQSTLVDPLTIY